jgi:hypothetical protein
MDKFTTPVATFACGAIQSPYKHKLAHTLAVKRGGGARGNETHEKENGQGIPVDRFE